MEHVGNYTIHGSYGKGKISFSKELILDLLVRWLEKIQVFPKWWCKMVIYHGSIRQRSPFRNTSNVNGGYTFGTQYLEDHPIY